MAEARNLWLRFQDELPAPKQGSSCRTLQSDANEGLALPIEHALRAAVDYRIAAELFAPIELDPDWPEPTRPHPTGNGWVHRDTIEEDEPSIAAMSERWLGISAEEVAVEAQSLPLPVVDYRPTASSSWSRSTRSADLTAFVADLASTNT